MSHHPIVIIGAGPAGVACAVQCKRLGIEPLLLDRSGECGGLVQNAWRVENYPGLASPISGSEFAGRLKGHLDAFGVEVVPGEAVALRRVDNCVEVALASGVSLTAPHVVVAVGTTPQPLGLPNEGILSGSRLFYEVRQLLGRGVRHVAVVGGGEAAFDYAMSLASRGTRATICLRGRESRAGARLTACVRQTRGIDLLFETHVEYARRTEHGLTVGLMGPGGLHDEQVDALLVAVGRRSMAPKLWETLSEGASPREGPSLPLASGPVDAAYGSREFSGAAVLTSLPGLYTCGDARLGSLGQIGIAVGDGMQAALLAAKALAQD